MYLIYSKLFNEVPYYQHDSPLGLYRALSGEEGSEIDEEGGPQCLPDH